MLAGDEVGFCASGNATGVETVDELDELVIEASDSAGATGSVGSADSVATVESVARAAAAAAEGEVKGDADPSCSWFCSTDSVFSRSSGGRQSNLQIGHKRDFSVNQGSN